MQISRSEQKRRVKEVEKLVEELATLPPQVIDQAPLPEEFKELLQEAAGLQGGARQRQIRYLTKLARELHLDPLYDLLSRHRGNTLSAKKQLHDLEFYRDALIEEALERQRFCRQTDQEWEENWSSNTLLEIREQLPEIDIPSLSRLSYLFARTRNPRYSREIFRSLRSAHEALLRRRSRSV